MASSFVPTSPPSLLFHDVQTLQTSIFAIPYIVFQCFSTFSENASETLSSSLLNPRRLPKGAQNVPNILPRLPKRAAQRRPWPWLGVLRAWLGILRAPQSSQELPKRALKCFRGSPEAPKWLPREPQMASRRLPSTFCVPQHYHPTRLKICRPNTLHPCSPTSL